MRLEERLPRDDVPPTDASPAGPLSRASGTARAGSNALRLRLDGLLNRLNLSAKLLFLTVLFVMLAEIVIFVPSIANFRTTWLTDRLTAAQLAAVAAEAFPGGEVPPALRDELLRTAAVKRISVKRNEQRRLVLNEEMDTPIDATYDMRMGNGGESGLLDAALLRLSLIKDALAVFVLPDKRMIRVIGQANMMPGQEVDVVLPQAPLKEAMVRFGLNILGLSILISALAGGLIYLTLRRLLVEPLTRLTENMLAFSAKPEDASRIIVPSARRDEVGTAERELAHMQGELNQILAQKNRLAALGLAVSKINHDLRNMLANAQLLSDNLTSVQDARVQRFAPKLIATLDRAISFCNDTLKFGRAAEAPPRRDLLLARPLVEEVVEGLGLPRHGLIDVKLEIGPQLRVDADRDHLYRILANLVRNAAQAIEAQTPPQPGTITIRASRGDRRANLSIIDDGPGMPAVARAHLFEAFQGSTRRGGSGLGLAIAYELVTMHGGTLTLADAATGQRGTTFLITLPDRTIDAA
jgi:signal transduction histidine kinase